MLGLRRTKQIQFPATPPQPAAPGLSTWQYNYLTAIATDSERFADLTNRAEHGDNKAEGWLALIYAFGAGVPTNRPEAFHWLLKAAENGNSNLWYIIGSTYFKGDPSYNVASNRVEAEKWFLKAADFGNASAQGKLGEIFIQGDGVSEDDASAIKWFRKAAAGNDITAEFYLGRMYETGQAVPQNYALSWCDQKKTSLCDQKENNAPSLLPLRICSLSSSVASAEDGALRGRNLSAV